MKHPNTAIPVDAITARDRQLLPALRDHKLLSLKQIWRLFWPAAKDDELARKRLSKLNHQYGLVECRHVSKVELAAAHLAYKKVYGLTEPGRAWLVAAGF
jgi:hypothetical protein